VSEQVEGRNERGKRERGREGGRNMQEREVYGRGEENKRAKWGKV